jgi:hypothetical protein
LQACFRSDFSDGWLELSDNTMRTHIGDPFFDPVIENVPKKPVKGPRKAANSIKDQHTEAVSWSFGIIAPTLSE